ncbi:MAG: precorrin-4 C(11)-methyltransferase [Planctomycetes bacterium]|nr:precorrin-4 C(11)-methyltransferase [Planctomycetota bacterium]
MIWFVGAGSGAADLITLRGQRLLERADLVIYAGSLVNPELLVNTKESCRHLDSSRMTLEEVVTAMLAAEAAGETTVRLHSGDPSLYGAIQEQMDALAAHGIEYAVVPGVSAWAAAAAALRAEYTLPGVSQTVIITRLAGRTPVPEAEELARLAAHGGSMAIFLSAGLLPAVQCQLLRGKYTEHTPAALVYKASWPEERTIRCTVGTLAETGRQHGIHKTAVILVGDFLAGPYERSRLYHPDFTTGFREGRHAD